MLRRVLLTLVFGLLSILIQGTVIRGLFPAAVVPSLLLILVVFLAFYETSVLGAVLAFLLGIEYDMCSALVVGPWSGTFVLVFGVVALLSQRIFVESPAAVMVTVFLSTLLSNVVYLLVVSQVRPSGVFFGWSVLLEALLTAAICIPFFSLYRKLLVPAPAGPGRRLGAHA
ncbi:MAG: rod shape-determining protein MreD [Deltaproteobacteria bacterium]|nr:rod shape-determining protein MreD [Deltaproteobacteria bacterium]